MDVTAAGGASTAASAITLESLRKQFPDGTVAVTSLDLRVEAGELAVLIGPSGCGKSTVLRMINRLVEPTAGRVLLDGVDVTHADPVALRRQIGYVIQHVGLFPHQTVRANIGTVPRLLGWDRRRIRARADELLELVGLPPGRYARRYPHELSGGQRQRVGVARALAADPVLLLMDEPFSAVDPITRTRLQEEFRRLQAEVRKTIVLVTHDLDEAVRLGDRIAVLSQGGVLEQYAEPGRLLGEPGTEFVREFVGADRGVRRLAVTPIRRELLISEPPERAGPEPVVPLAGSLYDALSAMLVAGTDRVLVTGPGGDRLGYLTRDAVLAPPARVPDPRVTGS
ncbi:MAG TPA: ATP-binding cassette domain-containing protein [Natronosporangium sp.]|nr:ATP-binding cassette domain-containing protein [Natronosporangium sp.]